MGGARRNCSLQSRCSVYPHPARTGPRFTKTIHGHVKGYAFLHHCVKTGGPSDRFHEIIVKGSQIRIFHDSNFRGRTPNLTGRSPVRVRVRLRPSTIGAIDPPPPPNAMQRVGITTSCSPRSSRCTIRTTSSWISRLRAPLWPVTRTPKPDGRC